MNIKPKTEISIDDDKPVYWDCYKKQLYWIEWISTRDDDIPIRHYIKMKEQNNE